MDCKSKTNRLSENKKRKKNNIFYNIQNNQVTSKKTDVKKKMTSNCLIDPCTSNKNEILSISNSPTVCIETLHQKSEHIKSVSNDLVQELHSTGSDASSGLENSNKGTILKYNNPVNFIQCEHGDYFCCRLCHKSQLLIDTRRKLHESKLYYLRKFHCAMCDKGMRSLIDWKTHSVSLCHMEKIRNHPDFVSYECGGCKAVFFENREKILKHCRTAHNDSSGLPYVFKCMNEVFRDCLTTDPGNWKTWTFCGPCKKYSSIKFHCFSSNHVNKKTIHMKCNSCLIDFICNQDVYDKHLISSEHSMLEYLKINKTAINIFNIKLPPVILSRFIIEETKTTCNECRFQMVSNDKIIALHMTECIVKPDLSGKCTINIMKYFCAVCNETVTNFSQWKFHLILPSHLIKCYAIIDLVSYTCEVCLLHCYGNSYHVTEHQNIHPNNSEKHLSMFLAFNFKRINNNLKSGEYYYCEDCMTYAEVNSNSDHWNKSHKTKLKRFYCQPCRTEFFCIEDNNLYSKHILSSEHIILKYVTTKSSVPEQKLLPLVKSLKSQLQNDENRNLYALRNTLDVIKNQDSFITNLYLNWFNIIENQNKAVCITCDDQIEINDTALLTHLLACNQNPESYIHKINMEFFKCLECSFYCKNYHSWEKHVISHLNIESWCLYSYFCEGCTSLLYGRMNDIELHLHSEHKKIIIDMPLETVLLAKQLMRRNNNTKSSHIKCFCEPCKKILNTFEDYSHFNTDSHVSAVASDMIELFYCEHCQVEFYSSNKVYEFHKLTPEHIILSSKANINIDAKLSPKPSKLDTYIFQFINSKQLYDQTQSIGFFCFICDYLCFTLGVWITHTSGKDHIYSAKDHCIDHRCNICKTLMFGKRQHIFDHYSNRFHSILKSFNTCINVKKENDLLLKTNCGTKHMYDMEISKNNQNEATCNSLLESTSKMIGELSIESNHQQNSSILLQGLNESISNIKETPAKLSSDKCQIKSNIQMACCLLNECSNINKTHSITKTNELPFESNNENFSAFYASRIDVLKQLLKENEEIRPQFVFYCTTCDFITTIQIKWDEHNLIDHSNDIELRYQVYCEICNMYQFGTPDSFDKHRNTIEHLNMIDFQKLYNSNNMKNTVDILNEESKIPNKSISTGELCEIAVCNPISDKTSQISDKTDDLSEIIALISNSICGKTNDKIENKNTAVSNTVSVINKQEIISSKNDETEVDNRKVTIEIKGVKPDYRQNSWVELKKILSAYGYFRIYPKYNSAMVIYRKLSCLYQLLKDRENLEKKHKFTISIIFEEEKLPELSKFTVFEFGNKDILLNNINKLFNEINEEIINPDVHKRLMLLMTSVHQCADPLRHFKVGKVYAFGSRMSGLPLKDSDVDLYFDIGKAFTGAISNDLYLQEDLVRYFGKVFRSQINDFRQIQLITGARVPIVKFYHIPSNLNCDLSFKSGLSTHNTKLVRLYLALDRRVHWLVCAVVKRWALQNDLKNQSMFTSYALAWLVLFYLMAIKIVPPLKSLRAYASLSTDVMFIEDWDCTFCTPEKALQMWKVPEIPCWDLLLGFFKFYADPNKLKQFVLCPALGEAIPKEKFFDIPTTTPDILGFYKKKTGNVSQRCTKLRNNFFGEGLAVQDPFDLFHNITKTIVPKKLQGFSHLCNKTLEVMHNGIQPYYG
ncbi:Hypothetical protein CINCED_3A009726 [Cinara cedri]|uniref:Uncharacterized protein n=2 Tax=Cinara cedri TaxID=506608 RepID=A0A5E4NIK5_9HEMI|nr:Hypothetical protein CINCED_3A009726 [Cinara cedri]